MAHVYYDVYGYIFDDGPDELEASNYVLTTDLQNIGVVLDLPAPGLSRIIEECALSDQCSIYGNRRKWFGRFSKLIVCKSTVAK